jgi:hypothetical protein
MLSQHAELLQIRERATTVNALAAAVVMAIVAVSLNILGCPVPGVVTRAESTATYREWVRGTFGRAPDADRPVPAPHGGFRTAKDIPIQSYARHSSTRSLLRNHLPILLRYRRSSPVRVSTGFSCR